MLSLSVIIVNYNTAAEVVACVTSVLQQQNLPFDIWVIDNASVDDSVVRLRSTFGEKIQLIVSPHNLGFGRANNLAAAQAMGEYLYFLNPDAQLTDYNALKTLVEFMRAHSQCGLAGTTVIDSNSQNTIAPALHYPGQRHLTNSSDFAQLPGNIAWVQGSSMIIAKTLFDQLHGFDPDYFLYAEEADLCLRIRKAGYEIALCSAVHVQHIGGASQRSSSVAATRLKKQQALYIFYGKHYGVDQARRLAQRALWRSRWKMLWLKWMPTKENQWIRQRVIYQAAKEFLDRKYP